MQFVLMEPVNANLDLLAMVSHALVSTRNDQHELQILIDEITHYVRAWYRFFNTAMLKYRVVS